MKETKRFIRKEKDNEPIIGKWTYWDTMKGGKLGENSTGKVESLASPANAGTAGRKLFVEL